MSKIEKLFYEKMNHGKKVLIAYIMAGHPTLEASEELIYAVERGGAEIIELGIPFSDPLADGPVIQSAAQSALENGTTLARVFDMVKRVRQKTQVPLVFMAYYNSLLGYGVEAFFKECELVGIDGVIVPDLPYEEQQEVTPYLRENIPLIPFAAPTSGSRIKKILSGGRGFVYCISSLGVTGMQDGFHREIERFLSQVRSCTDLPLAVGFGISSRQDVKKLAPYVDGIIVGSAIVRKIEETNGNPGMVEAFIRELSDNRKEDTSLYIPSI